MNRTDIISSLSKYRDGLGLLVKRATDQCRKMLGTSFCELRGLLAERFIDSETGRMKLDSEQNEEKVEEMHELLVGDMQDEIAKKCGGLKEACAAMFNVQRLLALEAGLAEADKNLEKAERGEEVNPGQQQASSRLNDSWESDRTEEGDDGGGGGMAKWNANANANESKEEYAEDSFEEFVDDDYGEDE